MRIKNVSIENFKCFKGVDIDFGRLTLLTGANSSGKSSILYSILGVLQSGEFPFQFSPNGKYVNMGNFREMSHLHREENIIKIGLKIEGDGKESLNLVTLWEEDKTRKLPLLNKLEMKSGLFELEIVKEKNYTLNYKLLSHDLSATEFHWLEVIRMGLRGFRGAIKDSETKASTSYTFESFSELKKTGKKYDNNLLFNSILDSIVECFDSLDNSINFISSFRLYPERTYYEKSKTHLKVGKFGEDYENQVILWQTNQSEEYEELIRIMKRLSLLEDIGTRRLEGGRFELVVKVNEKGVPASLNDVGFGISQFLPIVVADLQLGKDSTLFVAQPEIHLHPSVQAQFGDYMVEQIQKTEKNYIIETHSEYLLNRIRLAIVKGEIPKDDVTIYYLSNDGQDVKTHKLEFTTDGRILNAPEDFFTTYQMDVMDIAVNAGGE